MQPQQCSTCTINSQNGLFHPLIGKPFKAIDWNTKCCQFVKKQGKTCLNPCDEINTSLNN